MKSLLPAFVFLFGIEARRLRAHVSGKRNRKKCLVIPGDGDPCPRCGEPMQIREYDGVDKKLPSHPFFIRWFCCMNKACKATLVMPARYKVDPDNPVIA
jgi:hypothetical protein